MCAREDSVPGPRKREGRQEGRQEQIAMTFDPSAYLTPRPVCLCMCLCWCLCVFVVCVCVFCGCGSECAHACVYAYVYTCVLLLLRGDRWFVTLLCDTDRFCYSEETDGL